MTAHCYLGLLSITCPAVSAFGNYSYHSLVLQSEAAPNGSTSQCYVLKDVYDQTAEFSADNDLPSCMRQAASMHFYRNSFCSTITVPN